MRRETVAVRDLVVLGAVLVWMPLSLANPFIAYLIWVWTGLIALNTYLYGFMASAQLNMMFALTAISMIGLGFDKRKLPFELNRSGILMVLFAVQATCSAVFAYPNIPRNWEMYTDLLKMFLLCLMMPMVVSGRFRIHAMVLTLGLGLGFHGMLDGLKLLASAGGHIARGNPKFGDNNHFAVAMALVIPILLYLYQVSARVWVRMGFLATAFLGALSVIATHSRGGLLCLFVIAFTIVTRSRRKFAGMLAIALTATAIVALAPDSWSERMETMKEPSEDGSFMGRVMAWKRGSAIALENPLLGGGFYSVQADSIYPQFAYKQGLLGFVQTPPPDGVALAAHSIYFQVMSDVGFLGFFLYLAILGAGFLAAAEIRRIARRADGRFDWASDLADALTASLLAFMAGGALVSLAYFEAIFMICMLLEIVKRQVLSDLASQPAAAGIAVDKPGVVRRAV